MSKISFIITSFSSGGAEHQLQELSNALVENGYEIEIATFADLSDHYELNDRILRTRIAQGKNKVIKLLALWKYLLTNKSDIIFSFGQREGILVSFPLYLTNRSFFLGERNTDLKRLPWRKRLCLNLTYRRATRIIPNSHTQGEIIRRNFPSCSSKITVITNYTDIYKYKCANYQNHKSLNICIFARYTTQKNYERFAYAIKMLKEDASVEFHFDWYGSIYGNNHEVSTHYLQFQNLIKEFDIEKQITLHDAIHNVAEKMQDFDAFCLPSIFEGFSNSLSEAISCGLPCIVSDVSDNKIMVVDEENGFLFDPYNVESIKNALMRFICLPYEVRKSMAIKSRMNAEKLFDKNKFVRKYQELLSRR